MRTKLFQLIRVSRVISLKRPNLKPSRNRQLMTSADVNA